MNTRTSITKSFAVCLLGILAAPLAQADVDPAIIEFAKAKTEIKKLDVRGKEVKEKDRVKNASCKARWSNNSAKFAAFAQIKRDDSDNRILCSQEYTYNMKVIFEGADKSETQLVYLKANEEAKTIEVKEVSAIDETKNGIYVLFTPETLYIMNYEKPGEPVFRKYENRQ